MAETPDSSIPPPPGPPRSADGRISPFAAGQPGSEQLGLDQPEASAPPGPPHKAGSKTLQLLEALKQVRLPGADADVVSAGRVKNLSISGGEVKFNILLDAPDEALETALEQQVAGRLGELSWIAECEMGFITPEQDIAAGRPLHAPVTELAAEQRLARVSSAALDGSAAQADRINAAHGPQRLGSLPDVKNVIAVGSGKGGVGKSTVAVNLALALLQAGCKVGLLDADVYGPSVPLMLGLREQPYVNDEEKLVPPELYGLKVMSIGLLLAPDQAVVWRGPMIHGVMRQFIGDVHWGALDYLIIDLPPGTGDAPLSLVQSLPLTSAIVVTTPQEVAASVAQKSVAMFSKMGIRVLGVIENMSGFVCPHCEQLSEIFGSGGGEKLAENHGVSFLGAVPLDIRMRKGGDVGQPLLLQFPKSELAEQFRKIAARLVQVSGEHAATTQA